MTILALEMRALRERRGPIKLGRKRDASRNFRPLRQALATSRYPFVAFSPMSLLTCLVAASASASDLVCVCPDVPSRPNVTVTSAPLALISQNLAELPSTNSNRRFMDCSLVMLSVLMDRETAPAQGDVCGVLVLGCGATSASLRTRTNEGNRGTPRSDSS